MLLWPPLTGTQLSPVAPQSWVLPSDHTPGNRPTGGLNQVRVSGFMCASTPGMSDSRTSDLPLLKKSYGGGDKPQYCCSLFGLLKDDQIFYRKNAWFIWLLRLAGRNWTVYLIVQGPICEDPQVEAEHREGPHDLFLPPSVTGGVFGSAGDQQPQQHLHRGASGFGLPNASETDPLSVTPALVSSHSVGSEPDVVVRPGAAPVTPATCALSHLRSSRLCHDTRLSPHFQLVTTLISFSVFATPTMIFAVSVDGRGKYCGFHNLFEELCSQ
ncbi:unnamed protein product [Schistocephalus solidus]|uniref:Glutaredoxin domain-containing protein n=1 Tax=Schistocephalus solidus TaxID=70667 RepID=A0A183SG33_SCHSO|nr:unnamed protein product [Schistocephalus solidus]